MWHDKYFKQRLLPGTADNEYGILIIFYKNNTVYKFNNFSVSLSLYPLYLMIQLTLGINVFYVSVGCYRYYCILKRIEKTFFAYFVICSVNKFEIKKRLCMLKIKTINKDTNH